MIDGQFLWLVFEAAFDAYRDFSGRDVGVERMSRERGMDLRAAGGWAFDGVSEGAAGGVAALGEVPAAGFIAQVKASGHWLTSDGIDDAAAQLGGPQGGGDREGEEDGGEAPRGA